MWQFGNWTESPPERSRLASGIEALLRPLLPQDFALHREFLGNCSEESLYQRFFQVLDRSKITQNDIARYVDFDNRRELAITAVAAAGNGPELGVVRLVQLARDRCEFALIVADPWQRQGLGSLLIEKAVAIAAHSRLQLEGYVLSSNQPMLALCRRFGFALECVAGEGLFRVCLAPLQTGSQTGTCFPPTPDALF